MPVPSLIDLWELANADDKQDIEGWRAPFDGVSRDQPRGEAGEAHPGRDQGAGRRRHHDRQPGNRRPLRYGDMLVLVRRRGNAFDAVIQALKHASIPVAGADRLKLTEHIAIIDLMNLADALLLPQDDLALAVALKSPLFGLDRRRPVHAGLAAQGIAARGAGRARRGRRQIRGTRCERLEAMRAPLCAARRRLRSMPGCSAATAAARESCGGSGTKPTTRSTNFSNWRWPMSARRRPRCRVSWRGCAPPTPR